MNQHVWLTLEEKQRVVYSYTSQPIIGHPSRLKVDIKEQKEIEIEIEEKIEPLERTIQLEKK